MDMIAGNKMVKMGIDIEIPFWRSTCCHFLGLKLFFVVGEFPWESLDGKDVYFFCLNGK